jgi:hypothetical protein
MTGIERGGYAWSPSWRIENKRAKCGFVFGDSSDDLGKLARVRARHARRRGAGATTEGPSRATLGVPG